MGWGSPSFQRLAALPSELGGEAQQKEGDAPPATSRPELAWLRISDRVRLGGLPLLSPQWTPRHPMDPFFLRRKNRQRRGALTIAAQFLGASLPRPLCPREPCALTGTERVKRSGLASGARKGSTGERLSLIWVPARQGPPPTRRRWESARPSDSPTSMNTQWQASSFPL